MSVEARHRGDTRTQIQRVALCRFTDDGYDKTSLREIAEDLGVTKAALYYHFRTKEDILTSLITDLSSSVAELVAWANAGESTHERRLEMLRRLATLMSGGVGDLIQCVQQNEASLTSLPQTIDLVHQIKHELWQACTPPDATLEDRLRAGVAITAMIFATRGGAELGGTEAERLEIALRIASDLLP